MQLSIMSSINHLLATLLIFISISISISTSTKTNLQITTLIHAPKVGVGVYAYLMDLSIGNPQLPFSAIFDTGSDLIWTQCQPCVHCYDQPTPIFDPAWTSPSYANVPCSSDLCAALPNSRCSDDGSCRYFYKYLSGPSTEGVLSTETFHFGEVSVPQLGFGCSDKSSGTFKGAGLVGLGRGELSLVTQLHATHFSYCLTSFDSNRTSILSIGEGSWSLYDLAGAVTTPLIQNPFFPSFYYLSLLGITIGETRLPIDKSAFEIREDGRGGTMIDTGTTYTFLNSRAFDLVRDEFIRQMEPLEPTNDLESDLSVCYKLTAAEFPIKVWKMVFHFDGGDWELVPENFFMYVKGSGVGCLTMVNAGYGGLSIIGNFQQQNMAVVHDLQKETLSFMHADCDHF